MAKNYAIPERPARTLGDLVANRRNWIHRRVETLEILPDGNTRRNISVDLTVPEFPVNSDFLLPLAVLKYRALTAFDLRSASGSALPMLTGEESTNVARAILRSAVDKKFHGHDLENSLTEIVYTKYREVTPGYIESLSYFESTLEKSEKSKNREELIFLAEDLIEGHLLIVELPSSQLPGERIIIKYSYEEPFPPRTFHSISPEWTFAHSRPDWSKSYHFELRVPQSLSIRNLSLRRLDYSTGELILLRGSAEVEDAGQTIANVSTNFVEDEEDSVFDQHWVAFQIGSANRGFPLNVLMIVVVTSVIVVSEVFQLPRLPGCNWPLHQAICTHTSDGIPVPVVVLASLAVFLGRKPEHRIVASVHVIPLILLVWCGSVLFIGALNAGRMLPSSLYSQIILSMPLLFLPVPFILVYWFRMYTDFTNYNLVSIMQKVVATVSLRRYPRGI
jgi:hypothetical protein